MAERSAPIGFRILVVLQRWYRRLLVPLFGDVCRFEPSCSDYFLEAVRLHGYGKGIVMGVWRIVRCNPYCQGGHDPVPLPKVGPARQRHG